MNTRAWSRLGRTLVATTITAVALLATPASSTALAADQVVPAAPHTYTIKLLIGNNLCLDADLHYIGNGTKMQTWTCNNQANQRWYRAQIGASYAWVSAANTTLCLDADANHIGSGDKVQLWRCSGRWNQSWSYPDGAYPHMNMFTLSDYCLDADANHIGNGDRVQIWRCNNEGQQFWEAHLNQ